MIAFLKENRRLLSWLAVIVMLLITSNSVLGAVEDDLTNYYAIDETSGSTIYDSFASLDGTLTNGSFTTGKLNNGYSMGSVSESKFIVFGGVSDFSYIQNSGEFTVSFWWYRDSDDFQMLFDSSNAGVATNKGFTVYYQTGATGLINTQGVKGSLPRIWNVDSSQGQVTKNAWNHIVIRGDGSTVKIYINGVERGSGAVGTLSTGDSSFNTRVGMQTSGSTTYRASGVIDEIAFFDVAKSTDDISALYNSGNGFNPLNVVVNNFEVSAVDFWDDSGINSFWADIDGVGNFSTTNGTIVSSLLQNNTNTYDISVGSANHFRRDYSSVAVSSNLGAELYASDIKFRAFDMSGAEVLANFTINSIKKGVNESFYLSAGEHTATVNGSFYGLLFAFNVTARDNKTFFVNDTYTAKYTVYARDVLNNNTVTGNFTLSNALYNYSVTINNVNNATFNISEGNYILDIVGVNRSDYSANVSINASGASSAYHYLYAYNSLWVRAFRQTDSVAIQNFNVTVSNETAEYSGVGALGIARLSLIPSGTYTVVVRASGYSSASYSLVMTDNSLQEIDAFLSSATDTFIFTVKDKNNNAILDDVTLTQKRFINGTLTTVASKLSDITGRVQFTYENGVEYTFIASKTGYTTKTFTLTILFDSYTLLLEPVLTTNNTVFLDDVIKTVDGYKLINGSSWFAVTFYSPLGSLESYSVNLTTPYGYSYVANNVAGGGSLNASLLTPLASYGDLANIKVCYKSTLNIGDKCSSYVFMFTNWNAREGSLKFFVDDMDNYSDKSKVYWFSIVLIGVMSLFGVAGLFVGEPLLVGAVGGVIGMVLGLFGGLITGAVAGLGIFVFIVVIVGRLLGRG